MHLRLYGKTKFLVLKLNKGRRPNNLSLLINPLLPQVVSNIWTHIHYKIFCKFPLSLAFPFSALLSFWHFQLSGSDLIYFEGATRQEGRQLERILVEI